MAIDLHVMRLRCGGLAALCLCALASVAAAQDAGTRVAADGGVKALPAPTKPTKPPPPKAQRPKPEDAAVVRDLELLMLMEMLKDYPLLDDSD